MKRSLAILIGILFLLVILCLFKSTIFRSIIRNGDSDVYDYKIFPSRIISQAKHPLPLYKDTAAITNQFYDLQKKIGLDEFLEQNNTLSFLIARNDTILFERYYNGSDSRYYSMYFSITKSVMSLLIGCAIDDKLIGDENDLVTKYIPEFKENGFNKVTVLDLLNMQAPLKYYENSNPFGKHVRFYYGNDLERDILNLTVNESNENEFIYSSGHYAILGLILKRVLGNETISQYLERKVWNPSGMENKGIFNIDNEDDGLEKCWCCLAGTSRDLLRFANIYLNNGKSNGQQIVSENWITKTLSPLFDSGIMQEYSYGWWLYSDTQSLMAVGKDGQFIYLTPAKSIIIIRLGEHRGHLNKNDWYELFAKITETF